MNGLLLPVVAEDNRPIRDAAGNLVSIPEHAMAFVAAMNHIHLAIKALDEGARMLQFAANQMEDDDIAETAQHLADVARSAEKRASLPAPKEATKEDIAVAIAEGGDHDVPEAAADAILSKFRVYPR